MSQTNIYHFERNEIKIAASTAASMVVISSTVGDDLLNLFFPDWEAARAWLAEALILVDEVQRTERRAEGVVVPRTHARTAVAS